MVAEGYRNMLGVDNNRYITASAFVGFYTWIKFTLMHGVEHKK
jgi:hypothetical protein